MKKKKISVGDFLGKAVSEEWPYSLMDNGAPTVGREGPVVLTISWGLGELGPCPRR